MAQRRGLCLVLALALLGQSFGVPLEVTRLRRGYADNELESKEQDAKRDLDQAASERRPVRQDNSLDNGDSKEEDTKPAESATTTAKTELATPINDDSDEDDDDFESPPAPAGGGGSNIFSLLRLANAFFPSSSGANSFMRHILRRYFNNQFYQPYGTSPYFTTGFNPTLYLRRQDINDNLVNVDEIKGLKPPPFQRQETEEDDDDDDDESESEQSDENDAAEEIDEPNNGNGNNGNSNDESKPKSGSKESNENGDENNSDYSDEPPEGDGQGGGILGILASLSGGEDGQSDLGSLLATISGIVANLSGGEGFDLNAIIASGIGLFVGLLSEGEENPGAVIASYLLTSLDTITGGGSKNNGAFFGTLLSKLIRGTSAGIDPEASSEENGKEPEKDSAGFFGSFLMALLGNMSKGSSGSSSSHPTDQKWR